MTSPASSAVPAHKPRQFAVLAALLLGIMIAPGLLRLRSSAGHITPPANRVTMTAFNVSQIDGATWRLADHRGQVVLVNFWATWCGPCREELPGIAALSRTQGLAVVGISLDSADDTTVRDFAAQHHLAYPIARVDPLWQLDQIPSGIPATILIDRSGRVAKTYSGAIRGKDFQADVDQLLAEPVRL